MAVDQKRLTEDDRILGAQVELFSLATDEDRMHALTLLKSYPEMRRLWDEFKKREPDIIATIEEGERKKVDGDELHSDRTPTAVIMALNYRDGIKECKALIDAIEMAVSSILDEEERTAVHYRYLKGHSYKELCAHMRSKYKDATIDRRLKRGIDSVANTFLITGVLQALKSEGKLRAI